MCIINNEKFYSFDNSQDLENLSLENNNLSISDIYIKNPDNPSRLVPAKLISFFIKGSKNESN